MWTTMTEARYNLWCCGPNTQLLLYIDIYSTTRVCSPRSALRSEQAWSLRLVGATIVMRGVG